MAEEDTAKFEAELQEKYGNKETTTTVEETVETEQAAPTEEKFDEEEAKARSNGWNPDKGDLTPREYNMRGEFIGKLIDAEKKIDTLHETITKMTVSQQEREEAARRDAIAQMEAKRREAVEVGDVDTYDAYSKQIDAANAEITESSVPEASPEVVSFKERNSDWYNTDTVENYEMSQFAHTVDNFLHTQNPNITDKEALAIVEAEVKKRFSARFKNSNQAAPSPVAGSTKSQKPSEGSVDLSELSDTQRDFYKKAVKGDIPGMSGKEYLKSLKQLKETGRID